MAFRLPNEIKRLADAIHGNKVDTGFEAHPAQLTTPEAVGKFIMGGNAIFTLVSKKTGTRFTYRVRAPQQRKGSVSHFVSVLTGHDNETDYVYLGQLYHDTLDFNRGSKSPIPHDAPSAKAFAWFAKQLHDHGRLPETVECWHEARCGRCARKLTVPSSIASGFGPECVQHV